MSAIFRRITDEISGEWTIFEPLCVTSMYGLLFVVSFLYRNGFGSRWISLPFQAGPRAS